MKTNAILRILCAETDREALQPILDALKVKGLKIADAESGLKKEELLLAVLSEAFFSDEEKEKALLQTLSTGAENVLPLKLDESEIPDELMNALYARNIIMAADRSPELIAERVLSAIPEKKSDLPKVLIAGAAVLVVLAGLLVWRSASTRSEPVSTPEPEEQMEEIINVSVAFGLTEEDLAKITGVMIVGDQAEFYTEGNHSFDSLATRSAEDGTGHYYSREDGHELPMTRYDDLRFLSLMPNLSYLYLTQMDAAELPDLTSSQKLSDVVLSDVNITDLGWLATPSLKSISIMNATDEARDLSPLTACRYLEHVGIDLGGRDVDFSGFAPPNLKTVNISNSSQYEPRTALDLSSLSACSELQECEIDRAPVTDLSFLENAENLKTLTLNSLDSLQDISALRNAKQLKSLAIEYCPRVTDYSPVAGCTALEEIHIQGDANPDAIRDASFLSDLPKLRDIALFACNLNNMNFLEGISRNQESIRLGFAGTIRDYTGLAFIKHYESLHVNPRDADNPERDSRGGTFSAVLPYIQDAQIDNLMLYTCRGVDLSALPDGIEDLSIRYGDLEDLSGLKPYSLRRLELWDCQYLQSLNGLENIPTLFRDNATVELSITGCPRLNDWSALEGTYLENLKLIGTYQIPDLSEIRMNVLQLESIEGLKDLHCLDSLDSSEGYNLELVGLDELYDLTPLRRLHGDKLLVPPQVADQAEELVEAGNFKKYDIVYPDRSWQPYEGGQELLSLEELETLPKSLLRKVERLRVLGDEVGGNEPGQIQDDWSTGEPVPVWFNQETQEITPLEQGSITDLGVLSELTGLKQLELYCQPLENLNGIQNLSSLEHLQVCSCPNLTDASAAFTLQELRELDISRNPIESIQGVQNLSGLRSFSISETDVSDLSPLQDCDFSDAYENDGLQLMIDGIPAEDFSALSSIRKLRSFRPNNLDAKLWVPALENTEVIELAAANCFHDNESFAAFVQAHPELERLDIPMNGDLTDLSPVLALENLQRLKVSSDMEAALEAVRAAKPGFEIEVQG